MNGPELPAKGSGQPILNTCQITIKDSLSGMVLILSRKRNSLVRIQRLKESVRGGYVMPPEASSIDTLLSRSKALADQMREEVDE